MEHLRLQGPERNFVGSLIVSETRKVVDDPCFVAVLEETTEGRTGIEGLKLAFKFLNGHGALGDESAQTAFIGVEHLVPFAQRLQFSPVSVQSFGGVGAVSEVRHVSIQVLQLAAKGLRAFFEQQCG